LDGQSEKLIEFNKRYDELKAKIMDMNEHFIELTNQHTKNNELYYTYKRDIHLLQSEMDSFKRFRDQLKRELGIAD